MREGNSPTLDRSICSTTALCMWSVTANIQLSKEVIIINKGGNK